MQPSDSASFGRDEGGTKAGRVLNTVAKVLMQSSLIDVAFCRRISDGSGAFSTARAHRVMFKSRSSRLRVILKSALWSGYMSFSYNSRQYIFLGYRRSHKE